MNHYRPILNENTGKVCLGSVKIIKLVGSNLRINKKRKSLKRCNLSIAALRSITIAALLLFTIPTAHADNLIWNGTAANNIWQTDGNTIWRSVSTPVSFTDGDNVTFDGTGHSKVNVYDRIYPYTIQINEGSYTFEGSGSIIGISLIKNGTGTLTINTTNEFTNGTTINNGKIIAGKANAFGYNKNVFIYAFDSTAYGTLDLNGYSPMSSKINLNGGALVNNNTGTAISTNNVIFGLGKFNNQKIGGDGTLKITSNLDGNNRITKVGKGTLTLSGTNTYSGGTEVNQGTLKLDSAKALSDKTVTVHKHTTDTNTVLDLNGKSIANDIYLDGGALVSNTAHATVSGNVTLVNNSQIGGALTISGTIDDDGLGKGVEIMQYAEVIFAGKNTYSGVTNIAENSELTASHVNALGTSSITNNGKLIIDIADGGVFDNMITGTGSVSISNTNTGKTVTFTNKNNDYTGETKVGYGVTLIGALPEGGNLTLAENAKYDLGNDSRTINKLLDDKTSKIDLGSHKLIITETSMVNSTITGIGAGADLVIRSKYGINPTDVSLTNANNNYDKTIIEFGNSLSVTDIDAIGSGIINNAGTLNLDLATDNTLANVIEGSGNINKLGSGLLFLAGNSESATGKLAVNNGTVAIGGSGNYGGEIAMSAGANVTFKQTGEWTFAGILSGEGDLAVNEGIVMLNKSNNSFTGNVNIADIGNVVVEHVDALGSGAITSNGKVQFNIEYGGEFDNVITGGGAVEVLKNVTLSGNNTYEGGTAVADGTILTLQHANALGSGTVSNNGILNFNIADSGEFDNEISGNGAIKILNDVTLSGDNEDYTGNTSIADGASLTVQHVNALGKGDIHVNNNGKLNFNTSGTYNNGITGDGAVYINQNTILSGINTYSGGTNVADNTTLTGVLPANGNLILTNNAKYILNGAQDIRTLSDTADSEVVLGSHKLTISGNGTVNSMISGDGAVEVLADVIFNGTNTYSGGTIVAADKTLTGALPSGGDLTLLDNATYNLGGADRTIGTLTDTAHSKIELGDKTLKITKDCIIHGTITGAGSFEFTADVKFAENAKLDIDKLTVAAGQTLAVTAVKDPEFSAFQNTNLILEDNAKLETTLLTPDTYDLQAGQTMQVYIGNNITFTNNGNNNTVTVGHDLYKSVGELKFDPNTRQLYYTLKREPIRNVLPDLPPDTGNAIDNYTSSNNFLDHLFTDTSVSKEQKAVALQSALDIANLTSPITAVFQAKMGISNTIHARSQIVPQSFGSHYRGQSYNGSVKREAWTASIYGNSKGFRLSSGNFQYGYVNDQYAMAFGVDTVDDGMRLGIMGLGGWGKARSSGDLLPTYNESSVGGMYLYANKRSGNTDYLFTAGYLGMDNDFEQINLGGNLTGKMNSGLATVSATITKTYCLGEMHMSPVFGIEYGYYHQGASDVNWNNIAAMHNDKTHADIVTLPIGVNFTTENRLANDAVLTPEFRGRYIVNIGDVVSNYAVSLPGSSSSAMTATRMSDRHAGDFGVGLDLTRDGATLRVDYGYMFSEHYRDHYGSVVMKWAF